MTGLRRLPAAMVFHRIGDAQGQYPIWSDAGARRYAGRWHQAGDPVIYGSEHYATAMLEKLAYFQGEPPPRQHRTEITAPQGVSYELFADHLAPLWREPDDPGARSFGHAWVREGRSVILFVPSAIAPIERNVVINTAHEEFARLTPGLETPVWWDARLFGP